MSKLDHYFLSACWNIKFYRDTLADVRTFAELESSTDYETYLPSGRSPARSQVQILERPKDSSKRCCLRPKWARKTRTESKKQNLRGSVEVSNSTVTLARICTFAELECSTESWRKYRKELSTDHSVNRRCVTQLCSRITQMIQILGCLHDEKSRQLISSESKDDSNNAILNHRETASTNRPRRRVKLKFEEGPRLAKRALPTMFTKRPKASVVAPPSILVKPHSNHLSTNLVLIPVATMGKHPEGTVSD